MPNRHNVDAENYRYAYQGQEKDPETGKEAFELRLYDARIGRWQCPDPYYVHHSPYVGMANNPVGIIDRDGGIPVPIITGAIGAIINAGINVYSQYQSGQLDWSSGKTWARIGVAAGGGFIAGATGNLAAATATNMVFDVADQLITNDGNFSEINYTQTLYMGATTFVGGKLGGKLANNHFIKAQSMAIHERIFSSKAFNPYLGKVTRTLNKSVSEIWDMSMKNSSEVFSGMAISGMVSSYSPNSDIIRNTFKKPNFDNYNFNFMNQQQFMMNQLMNNCMNLINSSSNNGFTVGPLEFRGIDY